jgi:erythromycin esterase-like protein
MTTRSPPLTDLVRAGSQLMGSGERDDEELLSMGGDRSVVLLGEASHGTQEFHAMRADITHRLIAEQGFDAVAVEADWPDALNLDRYARSPDDVADAERCPPGRERWRT